MGDLDSALTFLRSAADAHAANGETTGLLKTRWSIASILVLQQRYEEADRLLAEVIDAFSKLDMREDVVLARLDRAELLIVQHQFSEAAKICQAVLDELRGSGLEQTSRALTAVSYLTEATLARKATSALVRTVRNFVRDVRTQPALLFAPPPL